MNWCFCLRERILVTSGKGNFSNFLISGAYYVSMYLSLVGGLEEMTALCQGIALLEQIICNRNVFTKISAILNVVCCTPGKNS